MSQMRRADFASDCWKRLTLTLEARRAELLAQLENPNTTPDQTTLIRGRLAELKKTLALPTPTAPAKRPAPSTDGQYGIQDGADD